MGDLDWIYWWLVAGGLRLKWIASCHAVDWGCCGVVIGFDTPLPSQSINRFAVFRFDRTIHHYYPLPGRATSLAWSRSNTFEVITT